MAKAFCSPATASAQADALFIVAFDDHPVSRSIRAHAGANAKLVEAMASEQKFEGKSKQVLICRVAVSKGPSYLVFLGGGPSSAAASLIWLRLAGQLARVARSIGAARAGLVGAFDKGPLALPERVTLITRGFALGSYDFSEYRKPGARAQEVSPALTLALDKTDVLERARAHGEVTGRAQALARDLVNTPPNVLFPQSFAQKAQQLGKKAGLKVSVLKEAELKKLGMNLLLAVGEASARPPRLVHLVCPAHAPSQKLDPVCFVGKGITFDSGGLCLKSADSMVTMKMDMGGAAAVLAALCAARSMKLPFAVHGVLALAENMPAGNALRTGDVLKSAQGQTIEVNNTDAEGRLVLADAIDYAKKKIKPGLLVDLATLTGACMVALGPHTVGLFSNRDAVASEVLEAACGAGEDMWRLPLTQALRDQLKSDVADMRNTGDRLGGAITAALFLQEFVGETAWAHLDIAGPAFTGEDQGHVSKGGTGVGAATLIELLARRVHRIEH